MDKSHEAKTHRKLLQKLNSIKTQNESKLWIFKMTLKITPRVLHIDYAQAYQCELQHEIMKALWTKGSVNLFTCAVYNNSQTKTLVFGTSYKGQDKFSSGLFIETLYKEHILPNETVQEEIIWSDGPTSEFKNHYVTLDSKAIYNLQQTFWGMSKFTCVQKHCCYVKIRISYKMQKAFANLLSS